MKKILILIPVYNDWDSVFKLIDNIDKMISNANINILIVNDMSTISYKFNINKFNNIASINILNLKKNGGHREAIATGLIYSNNNLKFDYIIPMDGDGEDRPIEINLFLDCINKKKTEIIVAERVKRSEGFIFRACYSIHKLLTFIFIGKIIKFGNYTCLSKIAVEKILSNGQLKVSFSGAVKFHYPKYDTIPSIRGSRYYGPTKMSFLKLILHSFRIWAVFRNIFFLRVSLLAFFFLIFSYFSYAIFSVFSIILFMLIVIIGSLSADNNLNKLKNYKSNIKDTLNLYSR